MAHDEIGEETLHRISRMTGFNKWMFEVLEPYLGKKVLEIGCGIGNITELMAPERDLFVLDIEQEYIDCVLRKESDMGPKSLCGTVADISRPLPKEIVDFRPDTVVCLNVLEHVEDDAAAIRNMFDVLEPGGKLILLVPSYQSLHGTLDVALSHFRRYSKSDLLRLASYDGIELAKTFYMNLFGIPGWWLNGKVLKRELLPTGMLDLYHVLVPIFRFIEKVTGPPAGLSVIGVYQKSA